MLTCLTTLHRTLRPRSSMQASGWPFWPVPVRRMRPTSWWPRHNGWAPISAKPAWQGRGAGRSAIRDRAIGLLGSASSSDLMGCGTLLSVRSNIPCAEHPSCASLAWPSSCSVREWRSVETMSRLATVGHKRKYVFACPVSSCRRVNGDLPCPPPCGKLLFHGRTHVVFRGRDHVEAQKTSAATLTAAPRMHTPDHPARAYTAVDAIAPVPLPTA